MLLLTIMPAEHSVGAVIYREGKYLLLYKKAHGIYLEGWYLVRGLIEEGEEIEDTVRREIEEETGIKDLFFVKGFKETTKWFYRNDKKETVFKTAVYLFAETKTEKVKLSEEHDDYAWLDFTHSVQKLRFVNDREVLRKADKFIELMKRI